MQAEHTAHTRPSRREAIELEAIERLLAGIDYEAIAAQSISHNAANVAWLARELATSLVHDADLTNGRKSVTSGNLVVTITDTTASLAVGNLARTVPGLTWEVSIGTRESVRGPKANWRERANEWWRRISARRTPLPDADREKFDASLHNAVASNQLELVEALLQRGADVNARDAQGYTPLHLAVSRRNHLMMKQLLCRGADRERTNKEGMTPLMLAREMRDADAAELLWEPAPNQDPLDVPPAPDLGSTDWEARRSAVATLSDPVEIARIATTDDEPLVRAAAVQRISDPALLAHIAVEDNHWLPRRTATRKMLDQTLLRQIAVNEQEEEEVRAAAIHNLTDPVVLDEFYRTFQNPGLRAAAVRAMTDQARLIEIWRNEPDEDVRVEAIGRMTPESIEVMAEQ